MAALAIVVSDAFARRAIEKTLAAVFPPGSCTLYAPDFTPDTGDTVLWVAAAGEEKAIPASVEERNRFRAPLRIGLLVDRVRALAAAPREKSSRVCVIGSYRLSAGALIDPATGDVVRLTEKEAQILEFLSQRKGAVVDRRELLDAVWGYGSDIETHTLETHIYRLRQKIEKDPAAPALLLTEAQGYRIKT